MAGIGADVVADQRAGVQPDRRRKQILDLHRHRIEAGRRINLGCSGQTGSGITATGLTV